MGAVELATGYISIAVSTKGLGAGVNKRFMNIERQAEASGKRSGKKMAAGMGGALKAGLVGAAAIAGVAAVKGFGSIIKAASSAEQAVGGVGAVFGKNADEIIGASKRAAKSAGLSTTAYQELATALGAGLKNQGVKDFTGSTETLIGIGADLAAQFGGSSKEAVEALASAMRGETDPIERYGVSLNESAVNAELARRGQDKLTGQALITAKAEARLALITRQTADAQGAFARESDTFAGKLQIAGAQWENLKTKIGTIFLPIATKVMAFIADKLIPGLETVGSIIRTHVGPAFNTVKGVISGFLASLSGGGGGGIAKFIAPVVGAFQGLVSVGQRLGAVVLPIIRQIAAAFLSQWPTIKPVIVGIFNTIRSTVVDVMGIIAKVVGSVTNIIQLIWSRWGGRITTIVVTLFKTLVKLISGAMKIIGGIVKLVLGLITGDWSKARAGIKMIASGLKTIVVAIFKALGTILKNTVGAFLAFIVGKFRSWDASVTRIVTGWRNSIIQKVKDLASRVRTAISDMLSRVRDRFASGVAAIGRAWDKLKDKAKAPIRFVVETVINKGLIGAFNKIAGIIPGVSKLPSVSVGFAQGGWTGPGAKMQPAGIVHADEYVINKRSRRQIERDQPGLLDQLNRVGYASGGLVGGSGRFTSRFASVLLLAQRMASSQFRIFQRGFRPSTSYSGTSHRGDAVDLGPSTARNVAILRALGVAAWRRGPGFPGGFSTAHIHGVPLPGFGRAGGSGIWQALDYLRGGDGLGGRDYEARNTGIARLGGALGKLGEFIKSGFTSLKDWFSSLIKGPMGKLNSIRNSPLGRLAAGTPGLLVEGMKKKIDVFDSGGYLRPGLSLAYNGTGRPEQVSPPGMGGVVVNGNIYGYSAEEVAAQIEKRARRQRALRPVFAP